MPSPSWRPTRPQCRHPDQPELGADAVNGQTESHLLRKGETTLGFALQ
jgi:hypothetical protein